MAHVLLVTAFQLSDPVPDFVLMVAADSLAQDYAPAPARSGGME